MTEQSSNNGGPGDSFTGIHRVSPTDEVRAQLLRAIEAGEYSAGARLPSERQLVQLFGVSRVSVREAMIRLEAMGIIKIVHGRGCYVAEDLPAFISEGFLRLVQANSDQVLDVLKVRGALDRLAAYEAALRADQEEPVQLVSAHDAFVAAVKNSSGIDELIKRDIDFHQAVADASGSALIGTLLRQLSEHVGDARRAILSSPDRPTLSMLEHGIIVEAVVAGDAERARKAAEDHVRNIQTWSEEQFSSLR